MDDKTPWQRVNKRKLIERFAIEIGPAIVFVIALQAVHLQGATLLFVVATAAAASYSWIEKRRFPLIPAGMVLLAALFGAMTIVSDNPDYIQVRATIVNAGGAIAILAFLVNGRLVLKSSLQDGFRLTDGAWWMLSIRMAVFLFMMALLNEAVWRTTSVETWAWFKTVAPVFNILFLWLNWPLIRENLSAEDGAEMTEVPPAGGKSTLNPAAQMG
ncbi:inner membrane-spanning protein YciB [Acuticoccus yangtzensis]|uniref:inner membrane-spanning protein YciB n=1 Tax=Acuticoccus yangtzensis TaxID=1443441 RepID=UPI00094950A8|nr:septation protein IspZ [Acuticoccus yangtzensis]ORE95430.1 intracellular septation protein A [Stappia sp. 22II-S9-Z10]